MTDVVRRPRRARLVRRPGDRRPAAAPAAAGSTPAPHSVVQSLKSASGVVAPLTVLTALLLYVGWQRTRAYFSYFGVSTNLLGFTPQDYILRSADVGLGAVVLLASAAGVLLVLDRLAALGLQRASGRRSFRWLRLGLAAVGAALALYGLFGVTAHAAQAATPPLVSAGLIAAGAILLLRFGVGSSAQPALFGPATAAFGLVVLALTAFWAANSYAQSIGTAAAVNVDRDQSELVVVTVYSAEPLDLPGASIVATKVPAAEGKSAYRYVGARLLTYAANRWFLITGPPSTSYHSTVVVLRDTESIRVETTKPRTSDDD